MGRNVMFTRFRGSELEEVSYEYFSYFSMNICEALLISAYKCFYGEIRKLSQNDHQIPILNPL